MHPPPTAAVAALGFVAGFAVADITGGRPLGGVVLVLAGIWCARVWLRRDGRRTAALLVGVAFVAFVASHLLGLAIGAWPAVVVSAAVVAGVCWRVSDARAAAAAAGGRTADALP